MSRTPKPGAGLAGAWQPPRMEGNLKAHGMTQEDVRRDRALRASAPDLLTACKTVLHAHFSELSAKDRRALMSAAIRRVEIAIERAEGGV